MIEDKDGKILDVHYLPAGARIEVLEGQQVQAGQLLAHQPEHGRNADITGGLPRVTEVFEARKPKDPAAIAEISGRVELKSDKRKGKMTITSGRNREWKKNTTCLATDTLTFTQAIWSSGRYADRRAACAARYPENQRRRGVAKIPHRRDSKRVSLTER